MPNSSYDSALFLMMSFLVAPATLDRLSLERTGRIAILSAAGNAHLQEADVLAQAAHQFERDLVVVLKKVSLRCDSYSPGYTSNKSQVARSWHFDGVLPAQGAKMATLQYLYAHRAIVGVRSVHFAVHDQALSYWLFRYVQNLAGLNLERYPFEIQKLGHCAREFYEPFRSLGEEALFDSLGCVASALYCELDAFNESQAACSLDDCSNQYGIMADRICAEARAVADEDVSVNHETLFLEEGDFVLWPAGRFHAAGEGVQSTRLVSGNKSNPAQMSWGQIVR